MFLMVASLTMFTMGCGAEKKTPKEKEKTPVTDTEKGTK